MRVAKTVEEIARACNVSITTVRLIINGQAERYRISTATQTRVQAYIDTFGYVINHTARSLKRRKSDMLGLIVPRLTNPFFAELATVLEAECRGNGYQLIIVSTNDVTAQESTLCDALLARGVDGLFVASGSATSQKALEARRKPIVFLDRDFGVRHHFPAVISDNYGGSRALSGHVLDITEAPLFLLCGNPALPTTRARIDGFADAHVERSRLLASDAILSGRDNSWNEGFRLMGALFARHSDTPPVLLASSLPILEGALHFLRSTTGGIPDTMIIGTFDDHHMLDFLPNRVFSIAQNAGNMAKTALGLMFPLLEGKSPPLEAITLPTRLVER